MTVYKIRRKSDGYFVNDGHQPIMFVRCVSSLGRIFRTKTAVKLHLKYNQLRYKDDFEIVEYDMQELSAYPIQDFL